MIFLCLFFVTCLCSNLELANFVNNFFIDLSWLLCTLTKLSCLDGALTMQHMNDIRWMRSIWLDEWAPPWSHLFGVLSIDVTISAPHAWVSSATADNDWDICITSILQQQYHVIEMVWNHGKTPYYHGRTPYYHGRTPYYHGRSPYYHGRTPNYHAWEDTLLPLEDTLLPWEDTLLPLQLIAVCIPDAAYD